MGWDGMGWDGMGWDGMGWDGMGWDGMGWDGMGWDGMGWDGMGWDGMGWDGYMAYFIPFLFEKASLHGLFHTISGSSYRFLAHLKPHLQEIQPHFGLP